MKFGLRLHPYAAFPSIGALNQDRATVWRSSGFDFVLLPEHTILWKHHERTTGKLWYEPGDFGGASRRPYDENALLHGRYWCCLSTIPSTLRSSSRRWTLSRKAGLASASAGLAARGNQHLMGGGPDKARRHHRGIHPG